MDAVVLQVAPALVLGDPLIHPVRLDQAQERLPRQVKRPDRRLENAHDGPRGRAAVARLELSLELIQRGEPVAFDLVAEDVDEARKSIDRAEVGPQAAGEEKGRDREVLGPGAAGDRADVHWQTIAGTPRPRQTACAAVGADG